MRLLLGSLFLLAFLVVATGASAGLLHHRWARAVVGPLVVVRTGARRRAALVAFLVLAALGCQRLIEFGPEFGRAPFFLAAAVSVLGAVALVTLPRAGEGWIGTRGVRLDWSATPWTTVESWRLVGEHLRFRVDERWRAIAVDVPDRDAVRAVLVAAAPDAESERS